MESWLTQNWGPVAAANIIEGVLTAALADMPFTGAPRPEFGEAVRLATSGRYVIYYEARDDSLVILRILHAARDRDGGRSQSSAPSFPRRVAAEALRDWRRAPFRASMPQ